MKAVAEAPSKTIITGEHFVVHGAWAVAAALPRRVRVEVEPAGSLAASSDRFPAGSPELRSVMGVVEAMARAHSFSPAVKVTVTSSIPQGAGLGSSAATFVALAAALSELNSLGLDAGGLVKESMVGEARVHGKPSGIDPTVCAHGGVVLFRPGTPPRQVALRRPVSLIVSYSGLNRRTSGLIGKVASVKKQHPGLFGALADSVGELSLGAAKMLRKGDLKGLGGSLTINHAALSSIGASNETLDSMVDLMLAMGSYGAKLTGAGGGGSVVAVAPKAKEKSIVSGLSRRGFDTFRANIPVKGVRSWLEP